jgi:putative sterol carrier protein
VLRIGKRANESKETAMAKFLSDEWFAKVKELTEDAGELNIPGPLKDLTINLNVTLADGSTKSVHLSGGQFAQGSAASAPVTVAVPADVAKKIFVDLDQQAGMQAFMSGQMRVEGDVTKLMVLQTVQPSAELRDLLEDVKDITE